MYYITSLAKFGHCCSMVWARRQGQWKDKTFGIFFSEEAAKSYALFYNVFSDVIFHPRVVQTFWVSKIIPVPVCLVAVMSWHSCYCD